MNVTVNVYLTREHNGSVGETIDRILDGLENLDNKQPKPSGMVMEEENEAYDMGLEEAEWGYCPGEMDDENVAVEQYWESDPRSELEMAVDDLSIAKQVMTQEEMDPTFFALYRNLLIDVINKVSVRLQNAVKVEKEGIVDGCTDISGYFTQCDQS